MEASSGRGGGYRLLRAGDGHTAWGRSFGVPRGLLAPVACVEEDVSHCSRQDALHGLLFVGRLEGVPLTATWMGSPFRSCISVPECIERKRVIMENKLLLQVNNASVRVEDKEILHHVNLCLGAGETHVLMGPNGTGKSTLGYTLAGNPRYEVTEEHHHLQGGRISPMRPRMSGQETVCSFLSRVRWRFRALPSAPFYPLRTGAAHRQAGFPLGTSKRS